MLNNWLHIFYYHIKNNKLFTILNILGLSIGIAALVFSLLYYNDEKSYDAWNPEKEKVFEVLQDLGGGNIWANNPAPLGAYFETQFQEVESYCYFNNWYYNEIIKYKDKKEILKFVDAQKNFFDFFPFEFLQGDPKACLSESSMAISDVAAQRIFGDQNPINREVEYSGRKLVVKGVYKLNTKSSIAPEAVTNLLESKLKNNKDHWGNYNFGLLIKLKDPNTAPEVRTKIEKVMYENTLVKWAKEEGLTPEEWLKKYDEEGNKVILEALQTAHLHSVIDSYPESKGNYQFLMIMLGLSVLILVLSIVNYVNLATANTIKRAKEVGVRKILGATKNNIIYQFVFETVIFVLFSILFALVIVELALPYYNDFLGKSLELNGSLFFIQLILIFFAVVVFAGIFPALYVSNFETLKVLKGNFSRSKRGIWLRNAMLIVQFAIASFFIVGSYIVYQQVHYMATKDLGFSGEQVIRISYRNKYGHNEEGYMKKNFSRFEMIKQELGKIKGVREVASGAFNFGGGATSSSSFIYNNVNIQGQNMAIDFDMLPMMNIKIKEGRNLSSKYASDTISSMLVNETAAKMMKDSALVGKEVNWNDHKLKVVGIVKDFHIYGPQAEIPPMAFFHFKTIDWMLSNLSQMYVKVDPENLEQTLSEIEKFWVQNVDNEYPFDYDFVDKNYARTYEQYVKQKNLFSLLNLVVILIALFGLFALAAFSIERRMKEIAIRKTLGQKPVLC
ncbi:ABC transporter permease [Flavobacterium sediminis]|uniref:ABC transporter permease n=1 Tax=Flavobacterium sediminis TaxID=2201181 RepID=UPI0026B156CB|nr:ABC transporter permease [Flavobacterium sediminis]